MKTLLILLLLIAVIHASLGYNSSSFDKKTLQIIYDVPTVEKLTLSFVEEREDFIAEASKKISKLSFNLFKAGDRLSLCATSQGALTLHTSKISAKVEGDFNEQFGLKGRVSFALFKGNSKGIFSVRVKPGEVNTRFTFLI